MSSAPRRNRIWTALSALYVVLLLGVALFYLLDPDLNTDDKVVATVGVAVVPCLAFGAAVTPLLSNSRNRVVLCSGAAFAWIAAFVQLMLTFGIALPLSCVLLGVGYADLKRAGRANSAMTG